MNRHGKRLFQAQPGTEPAWQKAAYPNEDSVPDGFAEAIEILNTSTSERNTLTQKEMLGALPLLIVACRKAAAARQAQANIPPLE